MKKYIALIIAGLFVCASALSETKFDSGSTAAEITFRAKVANQSVTAIAATSDKAGSFVKAYTRDSAGWYNPTAAATSTALIVSVANTGNALLVTNDIVVVQWEDGTVLKTTVSDNTATTITLGTALTQALTTDDRIFELTQVYQAGVGAASVTPEGNPIVAVPSDSPVYLVVDGNTNVYVSATVK